MIDVIGPNGHLFALQQLLSGAIRMYGRLRQRLALGAGLCRDYKLLPWNVPTMRRREFIAIVIGFSTLATALVPANVLAQEKEKIPRVGFMGNSTAALETNLIKPFRDGFRELGYEEGRSIEIVFRWAEGNYARFPKLIAELLAEKVDVLVTAGTPATLAVKKATSTVPLVMIAVGDPVGTKIVPSLARPGGNITGLSSRAPDLEGKRLELLREVVPHLTRVAFFLNPANAFHTVSMRQALDAAKALKIELKPYEVRKAEDLDAVFAGIIKDRPDGLLILADRVFLHNRKRLMDFATQQKLPSVNAYRELVEAGGLMSYGPSYEDMHRRAAIYVDKIIKGAKPGDLPIELPTKFNLLINTKAAVALKLKLPPMLISRADDLIE